MTGQLMTKLRATIFRAHQNESGAVALLCLAAVLALMMLSWTIVDAGKSVEDKVMLQGAADTAAFSHASVEARSMNMIAYANIAKRSVVGIHSMYPGMFFAYTTWLIKLASGCTPVPLPTLVRNPPDCLKFIANIPQWLAEAFGDHAKYSGNVFMPYIGGVIQTLADILSWLESVPFVPDFGIGDALEDAGSGMVMGFSKTAYARDLKALDNYQHYMQHITPWWSWSEGLVRGWRNGATSVSSFPPPPGNITAGLSIIENAIQTVNGVLSQFGLNTIDLTTYYGNDGLPIKKKSYGWSNWLCHMFLGRDDCGLSEAKQILKEGDFGSIATMGNESFTVEHLANTAIHKANSKLGAKSGFVTALGATVGFATVGIQYSRLAFGSLADPYVIDTGGSQGEWLKRSSNLTFAYLRDPERMNEQRNKFNIPAKEYNHSSPLGATVNDMLYKPSGYWTMSKSEITFNGSEGAINSAWAPDLWHPSWTARMRPVHLPGEFSEGGYSMFDAYIQTLPYLALSAQVGSMDGGGGFVSAVTGSMSDMAVMAAAAAAMGESTAGGVAK